MTGLPPMSQSLSRQRTISSSSSTHSQHAVGSRRRGSSPLSALGVQASNRPSPLLRRSMRHASLGGGRVDLQALSAGRADNVFQFGVRPPPSSVYTVCFTALNSVTY